MAVLVVGPRSALVGLCSGAALRHCSASGRGMETLRSGPWCAVGVPSRRRGVTMWLPAPR